MNTPQVRMSLRYTFEAALEVENQVVTRLMVQFRENTTSVIDAETGDSADGPGLGCSRGGRRRGRGARKAITATARKLACLIYNMLKHGTEYVDQGQEYYERRYQGRVLANLTRRARELGYHLVKTPESPAALV